ncbi:MAG: alpha-glucosidase [Proteobacteria bacterium]|nr:alpha-glucosidase [Pseudomonadota bacterium]
MIDLEKSDSGFSIAIGRKTLIRHHPEAPCVSAGEGSATYLARHSHYRIKDKITRKIAPDRWDIREATESWVVIEFEGFGIMTVAEAAGAVEIRFSGLDEQLNRLWFFLEASPGEHIYGCGEQYSELDLRGKLVPLWVQEQGVGRGKDLITLLANLRAGAGGAWHTTYFAQPTFVSSANYSCHIDATSYAEFDFRDPQRHILHIWQVPTAIRIEVADSAPEVIGRLSNYLGRQPELPEWAYDGIWLGIQGGTEIVDKKLRRARKKGVEVAALWAQDWEGIRITSFGKQLRWNWKYDHELYKDLPHYIAELAERGIRFLGYINPMLVPEGDLYREAADKGYLIVDQAGEIMHVVLTTFPAALVDLDNPAAVTWFKAVIKEHMLGIGMAGWMADFGEALPIDAVLYSGRSAERAHNQYPALWARVCREAVEEAGKLGDIVFFMRAGFTGSSRYSLAHWAGDQLVNWSLDDGFATVIPAGISLGFCAVAHFHSDIGGYTTVAWIKRKKELFMRWCEQAAFTPIMRTHEGNRPDSNWQFDSDDETLDHVARMTRVYVHLKEYHRALGREYTDTGLPPMRHPYIHYEADPVLHTLKYQYLYGRDLLVAPVYQPKKKSMRVYLPDDTWMHAWTGQSYSGGWHNVLAPLGQPPVFYRTSSPHRDRFDGLQTIR